MLRIFIINVHLIMAYSLLTVIMDSEKNYGGPILNYTLLAKSEKS